MAKKVLIVDDEKNIVDILEFNLRREGYETIAAYDGREAVKAATEGNPDIILLDVMLPYMDGFEVCKLVRMENPTVPIIMLTARESESDKVLGLEIGADDYVVKPFSVRELIARIGRNILRSYSGSAADLAPENILKIGELVIDIEKYSVFKNGKGIELTQREYDLLKCMAMEPRKVFSREDLMSIVWNYEYFGDLRAVDVAIRRLREKIEDNPADPRYVVTKRGIGYYCADGLQF